MFTVLYSGIRYAEPPIGQLRLSLPVRREAGLETELDVSGISEVVCPQWGADLTTSRTVSCSMSTSQVIIYLTKLY